MHWKIDKNKLLCSVPFIESKTLWVKFKTDTRKLYLSFVSQASFCQSVNSNKLSEKRQKQTNNKNLVSLSLPMNIEQKRKIDKLVWVFAVRTTLFLLFVYLYNYNICENTPNFFLFKHRISCKIGKLSLQSRRWHWHLLLQNA